MILENAPTGIRTRVFGSKGRNDWPDYTIGANINLANIKIRFFLDGAGAENRTRVTGSTVPKNNHYPTPAFKTYEHSY